MGQGQTSPRDLKPGALVLEDGTQFPGLLFGAPCKDPDAHVGYGEAVFNTSMAGYQEILTDPSYKGQIICMTTAHVGTTGVNARDAESDRLWTAGFVVREWTDAPSSWRSEESLDAYLKRHGVPGLHSADTRAITRRLRRDGVIRAMILSSDRLPRASEFFSKLPSFEGRDLIREVTTQKPVLFGAKGTRRFKVVALDYGIKRNLVEELTSRGCDVELVPASTSASDVLARKPDGIFLSNGPGDPTADSALAREVAKMVGKVPLFGVCMGHQILALSQGARAYKLKFGHRGGNQPVLDAASGRIEISSHNHGYAIDEKSLPSHVRVSHRNLNDKTVEGVVVQSGGAPAFSVQYHPEACPGPHDSAILFERFVEAMIECTKNTSNP